MLHLAANKINLKCIFLVFISVEVDVAFGRHQNASKMHFWVFISVEVDVAFGRQQNASKIYPML